jgi:hypothetical protein
LTVITVAGCSVCGVVGVDVAVVIVLVYTPPRFYVDEPHGSHA